MTDVQFTQFAHFALKRIKKNIGQMDIELEVLKDLDEAINQLCAEVKDIEKRILEDLCPYFGVLWPAATVLAEHIEKMGSWVKGKTVLELGCGLALPSIVAAKMGANVTATDFHKQVPQFLKRNQELNQIEFPFVEYDWQSGGATGLGTYDFIIGSDILYESQHPDQIARAFARHCKRGSHVLLTDPARPYLQSCIDALAAQGFRYDTFIREAKDSSDQTKEVFLIIFQKQ